jgi:hypothetical protein
MRTMKFNHYPRVKLVKKGGGLLHGSGLFGGRIRYITYDSIEAYSLGKFAKYIIQRTAKICLKTGMGAGVVQLIYGCENQTIYKTIV